MFKDPIVEEVRKTRREIESEFATPDAYFEHLEHLQELWKDRLIRRSPQPLLQKRIALG